MHQRIPQTPAGTGCFVLIALCVAVNSIPAEAGEVLMKSISEYYRGRKSSQQ